MTSVELELFTQINMIITAGYCLGGLMLLSRFSPSDSRTRSLQLFLIGVCAWAAFNSVLFSITRVYGPEVGMVAYRWLIILAILPGSIGADVIYTFMGSMTRTKRVVIYGGAGLIWLTEVIWPELVSSVGRVNMSGFPVEPGPAIHLHFAFIFVVVCWPLMVLARRAFIEPDPDIRKGWIILTCGAWISLIGGVGIQFYCMYILKPGPPVGQAFMIFFIMAVFWTFLHYQRVLSPRLLYQSTVKAIPNGLAHLDRGRVIWASGTLAEMLGYDGLEKLIDKPLSTIIADGSDALSVEWFSSGRTGENEVVLKKRTGDTLDCLVHIRPLDPAKSKGSQLVVFTDISRIKSIQDELARSENRYRTLIDKSADAIIVIRDGRMIFASPKAATLAGLSTEQLIGQHITSFVDEKTIEEINHRMEMRNAGTPVDDPYYSTIMTSDGQERKVETAVATIDWEGTEAVQVVVRDVTDRQRVEKERLNNERLQGALETAGAAAHELNQPLTVVSGQVELATMRLEQSHPAAKNLTTALEAIDRMGIITGHLGRIVRHRTKSYLDGDVKIMDLESASDSED